MLQMEGKYCILGGNYIPNMLRNMNISKVQEVIKNDFTLLGSKISSFGCSRIHLLSNIIVLHVYNVN